MVVSKRIYTAEPQSDPNRTGERPGYTCLFCAGPITPDFVCEGCLRCHTHCPYCGAEVIYGCNHLLAHPQDGVWFETGFYSSETQMPVLEPTANPSEYQLAEAFGDLLPILTAYENGLGDQPNRLTLFEQFIEHIATKVTIIHWFCNAAMTASEGQDHYAESREQAVDEIEALTETLRRRFQRIASIG
jgi:ferredoxin